MEFPLGSEVKDVVTGFSGIAVSRVTYLTGCVQYAVQPQKLKEDGTVADASYFDTQRLTQVGPWLFVPSSETGGEVRGKLPPAQYRG